MNHKQPTQRRGLGRGLGSLIPTGPPEQAGPRAEEQDSGTPSGGYVGAHSAVQSAVDSAETGAQTGLNGSGSATATLLEERPAEVAGAYFAELPVASITPERPPAAPGLRGGGDGGAGALDPRGRPAPAGRRTPHR